MGSRDHANSGRHIYILNGCLTDGIASSGSILHLLNLNETYFENLLSLLPRIQTWIGVNKIRPFTPEGWFEEFHGMKGLNKNDNGICMPYHSKGTFLWAPNSSAVALVMRKLREAVHTWPKILHIFIFIKLMMMVWGGLLLNMADLVVYGPPEAKFWPSSMHKLFVIELF